jgi:hypothetical protein
LLSEEQALQFPYPRDLLLRPRPDTCGGGIVWSGEWSPGVRIWPRATPNTPVYISGGGDVGDRIEKRYYPSHRIPETLPCESLEGTQCLVPSPFLVFGLHERNEMDGRAHIGHAKNHAEGGFSRLNQVL